MSVDRDTLRAAAEWHMHASINERMHRLASAALRLVAEMHCDFCQDGRAPHYCEKCSMGEPHKEPKDDGPCNECGGTGVHPDAQQVARTA